jgi:hypothetical protein
VHNFSYYVYFFSLRVSGNYAPIIRRNNCTLHTRQSSTQTDKYEVSYSYSYFSWWWARSCPKRVEKINKHTNILCRWLVCRVPWVPDSHLHRLINTKCRIDTVISPDDGHVVVRRVEKINKHTKKNCAQIWFYLQDYTGMQDQQNIKCSSPLHGVYSGSRVRTASCLMCPGSSVLGGKSGRGVNGLFTCA